MLTGALFMDEMKALTLLNSHTAVFRVASPINDNNSLSFQRLLMTERAMDSENVETHKVIFQGKTTYLLSH